MTDKRAKGQFYTEGNPFDCPAFEDWRMYAGVRPGEGAFPPFTILEPFAGRNGIIRHLSNVGIDYPYASFDIDPREESVTKRDTLESFPNGYKVCITNPPWLAKNSASRRGIPFPDCSHDNLYKFALEKCLKNCEYAAILVPESFIRTGLFRDRLSDFVTLTSCLFSDTKQPVGLALFKPKGYGTLLWIDEKRVGSWSDLQKFCPVPRKDGSKVTFNVPNGNVGLLAVDNTREASIRFCDVEELADYEVNHSKRHITKLFVEGDIDIEGWNRRLNEFREKTHDILLTSCRGLRKDGKYRRRLDWKTARGIIHG